MLRDSKAVIPIGNEYLARLRSLLTHISFILNTPTTSIAKVKPYLTYTWISNNRPSLGLTIALVALSQPNGKRSGLLRLAPNLLLRRTVRVLIWQSCTTRLAKACGGGRPDQEGHVRRRVLAAAKAAASRLRQWGHAHIEEQWRWQPLLRLRLAHYTSSKALHLEEK